MRLIPALILAASSIFQVVQAQSNLLEVVKNNPDQAKALCIRFKKLNDRGISSSSSEVIGEIARERNLSSRDAEILTTYVRGMNCPDVR